MISIRHSRQLILATYALGALIALSLVVAAHLMGGMALLVLFPLAKASAVLLVVALGVTSLLGTGALMTREGPRSAYAVATVALGWLGAIGISLYAARFWLH
jgi:hypothetical protein